MPKYKNKTQFTRPLQVNGKRVALRSGEIIFSERELDIAIYDFLEKVDDKVAATPNVKELTPQKIKVAKPEDVVKVKEQVESLAETIKHTPEELESVKKEQAALKEQVSIALKRLEIMKSVLETVSKENEELKGLVKDLQTDVYENGAIVIEGLDEQK